jgi:hypothetical protein
MYTLFDSFFSPTRVVVVSEERLQQAEKELKENQLRVIDNRIDELTAYRANLAKQIAPSNRIGKDLDQLDTMPSDQQPPGVDEQKEPQSLEEALTGG